MLTIYTGSTVIPTITYDNFKRRFDSSNFIILGSTMFAALFEHLSALTLYVFKWIPWVLPFCVAFGLYILHRLFKRTRRKIVEIKKQNEQSKAPDYNLTTAREYKAQYKAIAEQQLMEKIRTETKQKKSIELLDIGSLDKIEIIRSIRLFQSVETSILEELANAMVLKDFKSGEVVFGRECNGEGYVNDLNLLVVVKGQVEVYTEICQRTANTSEKTMNLLTVVGEGQTVSSILSILECLIEPIESETPFSAPATPKQRLIRAQQNWSNEQAASEDYEPPRRDSLKKTENEIDDEEVISAIASTDSLIAQIPLEIFHKLQDKFPRAITRLTRSIVMRLQRVTLLTMNKYFGLTNQLVSPEVKSIPPKRRRFQAREETLSKEMKLRRDFEIALRGFTKLLHLDEGGCELLRQSLLIERHSPGSIIMAPKDPYVSLTEDSQNDACDPCLYFIIRGCVDVYLHDDSHITNENDKIEVVNSDDHLLYTGHAGDLIGQLAVVTGDFYYRVVASEDEVNVSSRRQSSSREAETIILGKLRKNAFDQLVMYSPSVMNRIVFMIFLQLAPVVKLIDYAVDWEQRQAGEILMKQGDATDGMYIVLSGRLRAVRSIPDSEKQRADRERENNLFATGDDALQGTAVAEYGRGDSFGALEVLTDTPFSLSIVAVRDTELAVISGRLFKIFMRKFPEVVVRFGQIIGDSWRKQVIATDNSGDHSNLSTIAVLGINPETPISTFCARLAAELQELNPTSHLDKNYVMQSVGKNIFTDAKESSLIRWLGEIEEIYKFVVYECDNTLSPWTRRCLRQADCILLVSFSDENFEISAVEQYLLKNSNIAARKELVLLHKDHFYPKGTMNWLNLRRGWCRACHHVMDFKASQELNIDPRGVSRRTTLHGAGSLNILRPIGLIKRGAGSIWKRIKSQRQNTAPNTPIFGLANPRDDIARLSRLLTGKAIGLVLGGGGARGCAHVGVIQALEENGIPIDFVGGTSIGSMIGGLYAREPDYIHVLTKSRMLAKRLASKWAQILDLTYPRVSFFTGAALNEVLQQGFSRTKVEDLRLNYFAVSTNITNSKMMVHREGDLWKYVRASMSLVGFVPPICDIDGSLLVDGGYTNNIPADVMQSMGINTIIAVDVGGEVDTNYANYGDTLSGWWLLWNKWNPFVTRERIPNLSDIQAQLAYVSSEGVLEKVKKQKRCLYLRPPITQYGTLDFGKFDEIKDVGYTYAQEKITEWKKQRSHFTKPEQPERKERMVLRRRSSAGAKLQKFTAQ